MNCSVVFNESNSDEFNMKLPVDGKFGGHSIILPNGKKRGLQSVKITLPSQNSSNASVEDYKWLQLKVLAQQQLANNDVIITLSEDCFDSQLLN